MPSKIKVLSDSTINKIAAGEVIENPASVVKELVENSIDAGSTEICVEIKGGGRQLIRITDNGCGMSADDALLCLERHATSKIREVDDLDHIGTMGFRGEAIPSIASISKFMLITCDNEKQAGTMVAVDGGNIMKCCPAARSLGTTIEVKTLFFNVPARKKFQKSPTYDIQEIVKTLTLLSIGYPEIKFQLISNDETVLSTHKSLEDSFSGKLKDRLISVQGHDFFKQLCPIDGSKEGFSIQGFIGLPSFTKHNKTGQYLFINRRCVFSPLVSFAIRDSYGPMIAANRHPIFVLHLNVLGSMVDVNVHPQKREVRLRHEQILKELIASSVEQGLAHTGHATFQELPTFFESPEPVFFEPTPFAFSEIKEPLSAFSAESYKDFAIATPSLMSKEEVKGPIPVGSFFEKTDYTPTPKIIGTIPGYILVDPKTFPKSNADGLSVIDQRAAHTRVIFDTLRRKDKKIISQALLIPYSLECTPMESCMLKEQLEALNAAGISIKEFGPHSFLVDALPGFFGNINVSDFIKSLLKRFHESHASDFFSQEKEKIIALAAGRAAISMTQRLSIEEAQQLLNQLIHCQNYFLCPQGKSIIAHISLEEIAKQFHK